MLVGLLWGALYSVAASTWLFSLIGLAVAAGHALVVIGVAATSRAPHGPLGRGVKRLAVVAYALAIARPFIRSLRPFTGEDWSFYFQQFGEGLFWVNAYILGWAGPLAIVMLSALSAKFALRRGVPAAACGWALLAVWTVGIQAMPMSWTLSTSSWWIYPALGVQVGGCAAALYLARRLRLAIIGAAEAGA
jgi:hypothetical protein